MLTIYKCSGKNWQWTTSVEDTLYTGIQAYYIIKYMKTTTTLWKWSRKGSNSLPVYISLPKQTKSKAKIRLHVWNEKIVFFIIYVLALECYTLYRNCIFSDHICVLNLKNKMWVPRQVIGKVCTFLIIIIIKIQYTKQNQYNNKTFIMFIDRETQYDTKCRVIK